MFLDDPRNACPRSKPIKLGVVAYGIALMDQAAHLSIIDDFPLGKRAQCR